MTDVTAAKTTPVLDESVVFPAAILLSAFLVFSLQPIVGRLLLPSLGGSPAVWTTSMAFFQGGLLVGYAYANQLQRIGSIRLQILSHLAVLIVAATALPLQVSTVLGDPNVERPALWLLITLLISVGAPFAALSATAPLVQAWYARTRRGEAADRTYRLYAASNLGSLAALLGYPLLLEPVMTLTGQRWLWSAGYAVFVALLVGLFLTVRARAVAQVPTASTAAPAATWRRRALWTLLAAVPSSLMLGVTSHITTDVASAPLFWVLPLALYLGTFIIAFGDNRISDDRLLSIQVVLVALCLSGMYFSEDNFVLQLLIHLAAFTACALACHMRLYSLRPDPAHLTDFYLWLSVGGVLGGGFNAFLAPVLFTTVIEYPAALVLACFALAAAGNLKDRRLLALWAIGIVAAAGAPLIAALRGYDEAAVLGMRLCLLACVPLAFFVRRARLLLMSLVAALAISAFSISDYAQGGAVWRNFFGVVTISDVEDDALSGDVRSMTHGTTLHGAQARNPEIECRPLVYYAPATPIGQVFANLQSRKPALSVAVTGLGAGSVAAFVRPGDRMTFFEIDPLIVELASDPFYFSYTTTCARGAVDYVTGDARLTLARTPAGGYDLVLFDAFSSDAVPTHLLTREAIAMYLSKLRPGGVVVLHLSNRNLQLRDVAIASAEAAGGVTLLQRHSPTEEDSLLWESASDVVLVAKSREDLASFSGDSRWVAGDPSGARPWTDDYSNMVGPMLAQLFENLDL